MSQDNIGFQTENFAALAAAEADFWWFRARNRFLLWALRKHVVQFRDFLEVGCGTGFVLEGVSKAFPQVRLRGAELYEEALTFARQRVARASFSQLDARKLEDSESLDVIGAFDVIEHIQEDELVLRNLARALRKGGCLILTVPQHRWLWSAVDDHACHVRRYSRQELLGKVRAAGLEVVYVSSFVSFLVPLMWLSRRKARQHDHDPWREFRIPGWVNRGLEKVMLLELWMLQRGVTFPVGGSLLMVARKS